MEFPQSNFSEFLSQLAHQAKTAPPDRASVAVSHAAELLLLAGHGFAAYDAYMALLQGELCLSPGSVLVHHAESFLPNLCFALGIPYPTTPNRAAMTRPELEAYIQHEEENNWTLSSMDAWATPIPDGNWSEAYIQRMIGQIETDRPPERQKLLSFLRDLYRVVLRLLRNDQLNQALRLITVYDSVLETWQLDDKDWITKSIRMLHIDICFRLGRQDDAHARIVRWWREGPGPLIIRQAATTRALVEGALKADIPLTAEEVERFLYDVRNRTLIDEPYQPVTVEDWQCFLESWSREVIQLLRTHTCDWLDEREQQAVERGSLAYPGATDEQIQALETRLGITLPHSYVTFLKATNGWLQIGMDAGDGKLWSTEEVQWFRDQEPEWLAIWTERDDEIEVPDEKYFLYGEHQHCVNVRREYLKTALAVSEGVEAAIYLLNPQVVTEHGEWEAWFFGINLPGANRYRSFWEMMKAERQHVIESLRDVLE